MPVRSLARPLHGTRGHGEVHGATQARDRPAHSAICPQPRERERERSAGSLNALPRVSARRLHHFSFNAHALRNTWTARQRDTTHRKFRSRARLEQNYCHAYFGDDHFSGSPNPVGGLHEHTCRTPCTRRKAYARHDGHGMHHDTNSRTTHKPQTLFTSLRPTWWK